MRRDWRVVLVMGGWVGLVGQEPVVTIRAHEHLGSRGVSVAPSERRQVWHVVMRQLTHRGLRARHVEHVARHHERSGRRVVIGKGIHCLLGHGHHGGGNDRLVMVHARSTWHRPARVVPRMVPLGLRPCALFARGGVR